MLRRYDVLSRLVFWLGIAVVGTWVMDVVSIVLLLRVWQKIYHII